MFNKSGVTTVNLNNVTHLGENAFYACPNLKNIDLKKIQYIKGCVFKNTLLLEKLILPNYIGGNTTTSWYANSLAYGSRKLSLVDLGPNMLGIGQYIRYNNNSDYGYSMGSSGWSSVTVVFRSKSFVFVNSKNVLQHIWRCYCTEEMYDYLKNSSINSYPNIVYLIGGEQWVAQYGSADPYANLTPEEKAYYYPDVE